MTSSPRPARRAASLIAALALSGCVAAPEPGFGDFPPIGGGAPRAQAVPAPAAAPAAVPAAAPVVAATTGIPAEAPTTARSPVLSEVSRLVPLCVAALTQGYAQADSLAQQGYQVVRNNPGDRFYRLRLPSVSQGFLMQQIEREATFELEEKAFRPEGVCTIEITSEDEGRPFVALVSAEMSRLGFTGNIEDGWTRGSLFLDAYGTISFENRSAPEKTLGLIIQRNR